MGKVAQGLSLRVGTLQDKQAREKFCQEEREAARIASEKAAEEADCTYCRGLKNWQFYALIFLI